MKATDIPAFFFVLMLGLLFLSSAVVPGADARALPWVSSIRNASSSSASGSVSCSGSSASSSDGTEPAAVCLFNVTKRADITSSSSSSLNSFSNVTETGSNATSITTTTTTTTTNTGTRGSRNRQRNKKNTRRNGSSHGRKGKQRRFSVVNGTSDVDEVEVMMNVTKRSAAEDTPITPPVIPLETVERLAEEAEERDDPNATSIISPANVSEAIGETPTLRVVNLTLTGLQGSRLGAEKKKRAVMRRTARTGHLSDLQLFTPGSGLDENAANPWNGTNLAAVGRRSMSPRDSVLNVTVNVVENGGNGTA